MKLLKTLLILLFINVTGFAQKTSTVQFNADINNYFFFRPEVDTLYISGSFPDYYWTMPGTVPELMLTDLDEDMIYSLQMNLPVGDYEYKYYFRSGWDCGEWDGGTNNALSVEEDGQLIEINNVPGALNCYYTILFNINYENIPIEYASVNFERFDTQYTDVNGNTSYYINYIKGCELEYSISADGYFSESGSFDVTGCDQNINIDLSLAKTSVEKFSNKQIKIEKNKSQLILESKQEYKLSLYNIIGKQIYNKNILQGANIISTENFQSGIYILKFENKDERFVRKVIIN